MYVMVKNLQKKWSTKYTQYHFKQLGYKHSKYVCIIMLNATRMKTEKKPLRGSCKVNVLNDIIKRILNDCNVSSI